MDANGSQNGSHWAPFGVLVAPFWEPWASLGVQEGPGPPKAPFVIDSEVTFERFFGEMGTYLAFSTTWFSFSHFFAPPAPHAVVEAAQRPEDHQPREARYSITWFKRDILSPGLASEKRITRILSPGSASESLITRSAFRFIARPGLKATGSKAASKTRVSWRCFFWLLPVGLLEGSGPIVVSFGRTLGVFFLYF